MRALVTQFYQGERYVPDEILPADRAGGPGGARRVPRASAQGPARRDPPARSAATACRLLEMARENAEPELPRAPDGERQYERIERRAARASCTCATRRSASSASTSRTFQGGMAVGSMVAFDEGQPDKNGYRRFRIKTVAGQDDFAHDVRGAAPPLRRAPSASRYFPTCWSSTAARAAQRRARRCCASSRSTRSTPSAWRRCA